MAYWYLMLVLCCQTDCRKSSWLEAYRACRNDNKSLPCVSKTDFREISEKQRNANFSSVWINNDVIIEYKSLRLGCTVDVRCNPSTAEECIKKLTLHHRTNKNGENCCSKSINLNSVGRSRCGLEIQNAYIYDLNITQCSMILAIGGDICLVKTNQCNAEISDYICVEGGDKCDLEIRKQDIKAGSVLNTEPTQTRCIRRDNTTRDSAIKTSTVITNSTVTVDISVDITQQPPHKNLTAAIIVPVVIVFIAMALVGIIMFNKRCKTKKRRGRTENSLPLSNVMMSGLNKDGACESEYTEIKEADMHPISGSDANSNKKCNKNIEQPDAQNNYFILKPELNNCVDLKTDDNEYIETVIGEYDDLHGKSDRKRQNLADQNHIYAHGQTVASKDDTTYNIANSRPSEVDKSEYDTTGHV